MRVTHDSIMNTDNLVSPKCPICLCLKPNGTWRKILEVPESRRDQLRKLSYVKTPHTPTWFQWLETQCPNRLRFLCFPITENIVDNLYSLYTYQELNLNIAPHFPPGDHRACVKQVCIHGRRRARTCIL